ncbi:MAG: FkbM family methyltransferase [Betaproteobacteria bacterium]|nr:FkbM family methyltransferase [Betaproteobacteria bacterium]
MTGENITEKSEVLGNLLENLVAGTDQLSHEIAVRFIARRMSGVNLALPLDCEEQKRILSIAQAYCCPYNLPPPPPFIEQSLSAFPHLPYHMALHYGLNQFPSEMQKKVVGKDVIDGGGYCGDSAMIFTEYNPRKVYTFEPNPDTLPIMEQTLMDNADVLGERKDRIEIIPAALGRSKGTLTFHSRGVSDGGATAMAHLFPGAFNKANVYQVDVVSIDEFVEQQALSVGLIKLDVEGAEYDTILGAKNTITEQKPLLIISLYHTFKDFFEIKPLIESWGLDYKFEIRHHCPSAPDWEFVLMAY